MCSLKLLCIGSSAGNFGFDLSGIVGEGFALGEVLVMGDFLLLFLEQGPICLTCLVLIFPGLPLYFPCRNINLVFLLLGFLITLILTPFKW